MAQKDGMIPVQAALSSLRDALQEYASTLRDFYDAGSASSRQVTDSMQRVILAYRAATEALTQTQLALVDPWFARAAAEFSRLRPVVASANELVQRESGLKQQFAAATVAAAAAFVALPAAIAERVRQDAIVGVSLPKQLQFSCHVHRASRLWWIITVIGIGLSFVPGPPLLGVIVAFIGLGLFVLEKTLVARYLHPGAGLTGREAAQSANAIEVISKRIQKVNALCKDLDGLRLDWPETISQTVMDLHSGRDVAPNTLAERAATSVAIAASLCPFIQGTLDAPQRGS